MARLAPIDVLFGEMAMNPKGSTEQAIRNLVRVRKAVCILG